MPHEVSPWLLIESCAEIATTADYIDQNLTGSTDHEAVAVLAVVIGETRQMLSEIEDRAKQHLISILPRHGYVNKETGEIEQRLAKEYVIPGLDGPVTTKRSPRRTEWRNDVLWSDVLAAQGRSEEDLADLRAVLSLGWSLTGLRAIGIEPDDYCKADPAHESVQLPKRRLSERGSIATKGTEAAA